MLFTLHLGGRNANTIGVLCSFLFIHSLAKFVVFWFVFVFTGHLMGKKSSEESPYMSEGNSLKQQLREFIWWEEVTKNLLGFLEAKGNRSRQPPQLQDSGSRQPSWDTEDGSNLKDVGPKCRSETNVFVKWELEGGKV
jgi:hypothetical protein